ncbi:hypothetical protein HK096_002003, partial [Nowakowskiella sp. JEL0078]
TLSHTETLSIGNVSSGSLIGRRFQSREIPQFKQGSVFIYRFTSIQTHKATYEMIEPKKREYMHLEIARSQRQLMSTEDIEENARLIAINFNEGLLHVSENEEKIFIIKINNIAGKKSKLEKDLDSSKTFNFKALSILQTLPEYWSIDQKLAFTVIEEACDCLFQTGDFATIESLTNELFQNKNIRKCSICR